MPEEIIKTELIPYRPSLPSKAGYAEQLINGIPTYVPTEETVTQENLYKIVKILFTVEALRDDSILEELPDNLESFI